MNKQGCKNEEREKMASLRAAKKELRKIVSHKISGISGDAILEQCTLRLYHSSTLRYLQNISGYTSHIEAMHDTMLG